MMDLDAIIERNARKCKDVALARKKTTAREITAMRVRLARRLHKCVALKKD